MWTTGAGVPPGAGVGGGGRTSTDGRDRRAPLTVIIRPSATSIGVLGSPAAMFVASSASTDQRPAAAPTTSRSDMGAVASAPRTAPTAARPRAIAGLGPGAAPGRASTAERDGHQHHELSGIFAVTRVPCQPPSRSSAFPPRRQPGRRGCSRPLPRSTVPESKPAPSSSTLKQTPPSCSLRRTVAETPRPRAWLDSGGTPGNRSTPSSPRPPTCGRATCLRRDGDRRVARDVLERRADTTVAQSGGIDADVRYQRASAAVHSRGLARSRGRGSRPLGHALGHATACVIEFESCNLRRHAGFRTVSRKEDTTIPT